MNNFTFGDEGMGYYETIAGGAGAGPGWHGRRCALLFRNYSWKHPRWSR